MLIFKNYDLKLKFLKNDQNYVVFNVTYREKEIYD